VIFLRRNFVVVCCIFVVVAVTVGAQWRRIGNSSPEPDAALARDMLAAHNEIRARVNVPPLRWSDRLAARAQEWAIHLLRERQFYHRPNPVFGENLFEITGGRAWPTDVVGDWASESREYSYRSNTCHGVCGHYTQLIWSDTREVGCAVARDTGREVWVCNYDPPGNWIGERPY
jgi:pathogenesis-related protein 1